MKSKKQPAEHGSNIVALHRSVQEYKTSSECSQEHSAFNHCEIEDI